MEPPWPQHALALPRLAPSQLRALARAIATADADLYGQLDEAAVKALLREMGYPVLDGDVGLLMRLLNGEEEDLLWPQAGVPTSLNSPKSPALLRRGDGTPHFSSRLAQEVQCLLEDLHIPEEGVLEQCTADGLSLEHLKELSYDPGDLAAWLATTPLSAESRRRLVRRLHDLRNAQAHASRRIAIVVSCVDYLDPLAPCPRNGPYDVDMLCDALLTGGYAVHWLDSRAQHRSRQPTAANILQHLRAVGASLAMRAGPLDGVTVLLCLVGNARRAAAGDALHFMAYDAELGQEPDPGLALSALTAALPAGVTVCVLGDFAHVVSCDAAGRCSFGSSGAVLLSLGSEAETYRFAQPAGGGCLAQHLLEGLHTGVANPRGLALALDQQLECQQRPDPERANPLEWGAVQLVDPLPPVPAEGVTVRVLAVIDGDDTDTEVNALLRGFRPICRTFEHSGTVEETGQLALWLEGGLDGLLRVEGMRDVLGEQVDALTGRRHTRYAVQAAPASGGCVVFVSPASGGLPTPPDRFPGPGRDRPSSVASHHATPRSTPKAPAASPQTGRHRPLDPWLTGQSPRSEPLLRMALANGRETCSLGGLPVRACGAVVEVAGVAALRDALRLRAAAQAGGLAEARGLGVLLEPGWPLPRPGVIAHPGADIVAAMLRAEWEASEQRLRLRFAPGRPCPMASGRLVVLDASTLPDLERQIQDCVPGDVVQIRGKWSGCLVLERPGVTVRGVDFGAVFTNEGYPGPAMILRGGCRVENVKVLTENQYPAVLVESGAPELLAVEMSGSGLGAGLKLAPQTHPVVESCAMHHCLGPGAVAEACEGVFRRCVFTANALGVAVVGRPYRAGVRLEDCDVVANRGGGVACTDMGLACLQRCTVARNKDVGVLVEQEGDATLWQCFVTANESFGIKVCRGARAYVEDCQLSGNVEYELLIERPHTEAGSVNVLRNRFFQQFEHRLAATTAVDISHAASALVANAFEGYRNCLSLRGPCPALKVLLSHAVLIPGPDSAFLRPTSTAELPLKGNVEFNDVFTADLPADPPHVSNRAVALSSYSLAEATHLSLYAVVRRLIADRADLNANLREPPLLTAAANADVAMARLLLHGRADPTAADRAGRTALHAAVHAHHLPLARLLLAEKADPLQVDGNGVSAAAAAVEADNVETLRLLLHGDDQCHTFEGIWRRDPPRRWLQPTAPGPPGQSLVAAAAKLGRVAALELLIDAGASVEAEPEILSLTPLMAAVANGRLAAAEWLLRRGADPAAAQPDTDFPLLRAAYGGAPALVALLLDARADPRQEDAVGTRAVHAAAEMGHEAILELLLTDPSAITAPTRSGHTPLHCAAAHHHPACVRLLLAHGAAPTAADRAGRRPLQLAAGEAYELLRDVEAEGLLDACRGPGDGAALARRLQSGLPPPALQNAALLQAVLFRHSAGLAVLLHHGVRWTYAGPGRAPEVSPLTWAYHTRDSTAAALLQDAGMALTDLDRLHLHRLEEAARHSPDAAAALQWPEGWPALLADTATALGWRLLPAQPHAVRALPLLRGRMEAAWRAVQPGPVDPVGYAPDISMPLLPHLRSLMTQAAPSVTDHCLWDAQYALVRRVCLGLSPVPAPGQLVLTLHAHPQACHDAVCDALADDSLVSVGVWGWYLHTLTEALRRCPVPEVCYASAPDLVPARRAHLSADPVPASFFLLGAVLTFPTTAWATASEGVARDLLPPRGGTLVIMSPRTGATIAPYSCQPDLEEVLFPPGAHFVVVEVLAPPGEDYAAFCADFVRRHGPGRVPALVLRVDEVTAPDSP